MSHPPRYPMLDGWRAVACGLVFFNHLVGNDWGPAGSWWLGVQLFFVISGYCMAAATDSAITRGSGLGPFLARRVRRIAPPYLASLAFAIAVACCSGFAVGGLERAWQFLAQPPLLYLQNLTLTQWTAIPGALLLDKPAPVTAWDNKALFVQAYWSLNYEEQFYLLCGIAAAVGMVVRPALLFVTVTLCVGLFNVATAGFVTGLFLDYWLQFSAGILVFARLCKARSALGRGVIDAVLVLGLVVTGVVAQARGELEFTLARYQFHGQLALCLAFALVLIALRPVDNAWSATRVGRAFAWVGARSYSIYLFHQPLQKTFRFFVVPRLEPVMGLGGALVLEAVCAFVPCVLAFHLVERRFLNRAVAEPPPSP